MVEAGEEEKSLAGLATFWWVVTMINFIVPMGVLRAHAVIADGFPDMIVMPLASGDFSDYRFIGHSFSPD